NRNIIYDERTETPYTGDKGTETPNSMLPTTKNLNTISDEEY
ncbi:25098_t:CDS:1, partial [Racocetra persica]